VLGLTRRFSGLLHLYRYAERLNSTSWIWRIEWRAAALVEPRKGSVAVCLGWPSTKKSGRYTARAKLENRPSRVEEPGGATPGSSA
jgi:hypothetical protein